jgi:hypothetical protein
VNGEALQLALQDLLALLLVLLFIELAEPGAHLAAVSGRGKIAERRRQPVATRIQLLAGHDLHLVAVRQHGVQRHHAAVDLGAAAAMPEVGVHVIREVERCGAPLQLDHFAARRQCVDAVLEYLRADALEEIAVAFLSLAGFEQLA